MRRTTRGAMVVLLLLGLLVTAAPGSWWDSLATPKEVTLAKVLANPEAFKAVPVEFTVQFHETTKFYNPFFTRFTPETHLNFAAWGDEAALWMPEDFARSHPLFFVDKNTPYAETVLKIPPFTRLRIVGVVTSTFKGEAWILVRSLKVERQALSRTSLGHIIAGDKYAQEDRFNAAIQEYLQAWNAGDLPGPAKAAVAARLGRAYYEVQKPAEAQPFLEAAIKSNPDDEESKILLNRVIGKQAGQPDLAPPEPRIGGESERPLPEDAEPEARIVETPETGTAEPAPEPKAEPAKQPADDPDAETPGKRLSPPR